LAKIYQALMKPIKQRFVVESSELSRGMWCCLPATKMNVAGAGANMGAGQPSSASYLRVEGDPAWPAPVWGKQAAVALR